MQMTSIIIPNYNGLDYLKPCIESIRKYTDTPYEIIVVDNGSTDGTLEYCKHNSVNLVSLPFNRGFPVACNYGLRIASGDAIMLLNNDTLATRNWLKNMLNCLYSSNEIGLVGPVSNYISGKQQITEPFTNVKEIARKYNTQDPSKWIPTKRIVGMCFLMKREVFNRVGLMDERFSPGHFEDDDYCYRARQKGFKLMIAGDCFVFHHGSASFKKEEESYVKSLLEDNLRKFKEKWGFDPRLLT